MMFVCLFIYDRNLNRQNGLLKKVQRKREEKEKKKSN